MTNNEKLITWGLLALIAYELWPSKPTPNQFAGTHPSMAGNADQTPAWIQQLSAVEQQDLVQQFNIDNISNQITDNLLSIPQGPGGGTFIFPGPANYFTPSSGFFCGGSQMVAPQVLAPQVLVQA